MIRPWNKPGETIRETVSHWLSATTQRIAGKKKSSTSRAGLDDDLFVREIARARQIQELGYEIGFRFCNRAPDEAPLYVCVGTVAKKDIGTGCDYFSEAKAFQKSLNETVERMLWEEENPSWARDTVQSSFEDIGVPAIDPGAIAGFSEKQKDADLRLQCSRKTVLRWIRGTSLTEKGPCFVPLQMVSGHYGGAVMRGEIEEPVLCQSTTNGIATRETFEGAAYRGLLELIERDAFMISYLNRIAPPRIDHASITDSRVGHILEELRRYGLTCELLLLPTDMPATVVCAIIRDETGIGPAFGLGARAHADEMEAVIGALAEATLVWSRMRAIGLKERALTNLPWGIPERLTFWAKDENTEKLSWFWKGPIVPLPKAPRNAQNLRELSNALRKCGYRAAAVEMSSKPLKHLEVTSVFVVCPDLQPIDLVTHPPYRGGNRLETVPRLFGYTPSAEPPPYPHPFP